MIRPINQNGNCTVLATILLGVLTFVLTMSWPNQPGTSRGVQSQPETAKLDDRVLADAYSKMLARYKTAKEKEAALAWYFGFLEGRLRLVPPMHWIKNMETLEIIGDRNVVGVAASSFDYHRGEFGGVFISPGFSVALANQTPVIVKDERMVSLVQYDTGIKKYRTKNGIVSFDYLAACDDKDGLFLAIGGEAPRSFPLIHFNAGGQEKWQTNVTCYESGREEDELFIGFVEIDIEVTTNDSLVGVFGITQGMSFIEIFDKSNGERLARFNSMEQ